MKNSDNVIQKLYGKELNLRDIKRKFGSLAQFAGITAYECKSGKAKGSTVLDVRNGSGLHFTILPDRGLDVGMAEYMGRPISWVSRNGLVAPQNAEVSSLGFLRSFGGGLVTTCGLTQVGEGEQSLEGDLLPFHGRISHTPADYYNVSEDFCDIDNELTFSVSGKVRECRVYGENLVMDRKISTTFGKNEIHIQDKISNEGNRPWPLMLFYHINFGFPLVSEHSKYYTSAHQVCPYNNAAAQGDRDHQGMILEQDEYPFQCFVHEIPEEGNGIKAMILNEKLHFGIYLDYSTEELPFFNHWKVMEMQDYVVAFEPGNCMPEGQAQAKKENRLKILEPGETFETGFNLGLVEDEENANKIKALLAQKRKEQ
jgi:hypothetical protein